MSTGNIPKITVSNNGAFDASIYVLTGAGTPYALSPQVEAGSTISFDLTKVRGLNNGDIIQGRVVSGQAAQYTDQTLLTYHNNAKSQAFDAIAGTANAPVITFQNLDPINCISKTSTFP